MQIANERRRLNIFSKTAPGELDDIIKLLKDKKKKLMEISSFMHEEGYKLREDIISGMPTRTGHLANSVHVYYAPSTNRMTIKVNAPYAKAVEYGTGPRGVGTYPEAAPIGYSPDGWWFPARLSYAQELHNEYNMRFIVSKEDPNLAFVYTEGQRAKAFMYHARQRAFGPGGYIWQDALRWLKDGGEG